MVRLNSKVISINLGKVQPPEKPPQLASVLRPSDRPGENASGWFVARAQRVGFFNIGSGRVLDKIPGSGSGRVG